MSEENEGTRPLSSLADTQAHQDEQLKQRYLMCQLQPERK